MFSRLRFTEWQARNQPLEERLKEYREQHLQCTHGDAMPDPYMVFRKEDNIDGLGNQLPGFITGVHVSHVDCNLGKSDNTAEDMMRVDCYTCS